MVIYLFFNSSINNLITPLFIENLLRLEAKKNLAIIFSEIGK